MRKNQNSNYTTIEILGEVVGLKFGIQAISAVSEAQQKFPFYCEYTEDGKTYLKYNEVAWSHIIYAGYCNNCYSLNETPFYEFQDVYDEIENLYLDGKVDEVITPIINRFVQVVNEKLDQSKS